MYLKLILGPMFSGKTTRLISTYKTILSRNVIPSNILVVNHSFDTRYSNKYLATHTEVSNIKCNMMENLMPITKQYINEHDYKHIIINEGQFFNDILTWIRYIVEKHVNVEITISGLDADYKQEPFGDFLNIIPFCREIEKLTSNCYKCNSKTAEMTIRESEKTEQVVVGNQDIYKSICTDCFTPEEHQICTWCRSPIYCMDISGCFKDNIVDSFTNSTPYKY